MLQRIYIILIFSVFCPCAIAQLPVALNADLINSSPIGVNRKYIFSTPPVGYGKIQEFPIELHQSGNYFEEERNTAWFSIDIPINGILLFEITPHSAEDDYDWMLFTQSPQLKDELLKNPSLLLRSNNARNDKQIDSKTGLKDGYGNLYESPGPGKSYSKPLEVKKGEKLILAVDNIYPDGKGFDLELGLKYKADETGFLEGVIKDKVTGQPLQATVTIEDDLSGTFLAETTCDVTGKYKITIPLKTTVNVVVQHAGHLFQTTDVTASEPRNSQDFFLDKIALGNKLILHNIHFAPNKDVILHTSDTELKRLADFLKQEPQWAIKLVGHSNSNVFANPRYLQTLSFNRAVAVKNVLLKNEIPERRISCAGMGGKYPIIKTNDPVIGAINLRVEVVLQKSQ